MKKILLGLSIFLLLSTSCFAYLAKVNGEEITSNDFKQFLQEYHFYYQMNKGEMEKAGRLSSKNLKQKLNELIDEYLMAQEAKRLGLESDPFYIKAINNIRKRLALNEFWHEEMRKLNVTDKTLKQYFNDEYTKIEASQIFTKDEKKAREALRRLKAGESFAKVAKELSEDPFAQKGGKMGLISRKRMLKEWGEVAFSLKPGEISDIVKTKAGYHIIKVEKIVPPNPKVFEKHKKWLRNKYINERLEERKKQLLETLRKRAKIKLNQELLDKIEPEGECEGVLAIVNGEEIRVEDFMPLYKNYLWGEIAKARRWHFKLDETKIKQRVLDQLIDETLLAQEALKRGYLKKKEVQEALRRYQRYFLALTFRERIIVPQVKLSEKELKQYYRRHKEEFRSPAQYKLSIIKVPTREEAEGIREELMAGADFSLLARKKSISDTAKKGGLLGWVSENRLPPQIKVALAKLKPGEISPVLEENRKFIILRLEEKKLGQILPYDKIKLDIKKKLWYKKFREVLDKYLKKLRMISQIEINEEELKKLEKEFEIRS